jgi:hypothetical protein
MAHFSEMDFLFSTSPVGVNSPTQKMQNNVSVSKTEKIQNYVKDTIYNEDRKDNPYIDLTNYFNGEKASKSLNIKPSDLAYLRELGVYPINRMVILRRFAEGVTVPERLDELDIEPISVIAGWLKPDENFGKIGFNETWGHTQARIDELLTDMINTSFTKGQKLTSLIPVPNFAQGLLFGLLKDTGITGGQNSNWDWNNIPIGDPNVLMEGPYRDPAQQNIKSEFNFTFETIYEQKFIGDIDPGDAMINIIDSLLKMGTSNMKYWLNGKSGIVGAAKEAIDKSDLNYWWILIEKTLSELWKVIKTTISNITEFVTSSTDKVADFKEVLIKTLNSVLNATIARYRWELKGSMAMMTGDSPTPWFLTIGNPYSPWIASNHVVVQKVDIETSNEVGFNDMPMWLKVNITVSQSRNLGRNEILRMFNNIYIRKYSKTKPAEFVGNPIDTSGASDAAKQVDPFHKDQADLQDYSYKGKEYVTTDWGETEVPAETPAETSKYVTDTTKLKGI